MAATTAIVAIDKARVTAMTAHDREPVVAEHDRGVAGETVTRPPSTGEGASARETGDPNAHQSGSHAEDRALILATIRRSLGVTGVEEPRRLAVASRLAAHPAGVVPARGHVAARRDLFVRMVEGAAGTVERVANTSGIVTATAAFLRGQNLPQAIRHGDDARLMTLAWENTALQVQRGASDGRDLAAISHAFAAVAETGTLVLVSGADNPTTLNFLPDIHIVVVSAADIAPDFETAMARLRAHFGNGRMPRAVNLITGPSRSADIEQTLILGAHGPRKLHVILVGDA
jgi:L-lactate dehydrogenase complex protein LldG